MTPFDTAAVLIAVAAIAGYLNHRILRLPAASGTLVVALCSSTTVLLADAIVPTWHLRASFGDFLAYIDFNEALMHGMLSFLLFAGALHVDIEGLLDNKWTIGGLATMGVVVSTVVIGILSWFMLRLLDLSVPLLVCFVFGALISPTDPVAVMGLLKELRAPSSLEAQIAGESLFNDGVGVVIFLALVSVAGLSGVSDATHLEIDPTGLTTFVLREVAGGFGLGLGLGYVAYRALKSLDDHPLELLITLALVMFTYSLSFWITVSGPIAVVTAGILIGNRGRRFAMSERTREHVDAFWSMTDEVLNAVLFLLIGLQVFAVPVEPPTVIASVLTILVVLIARFVSVAIPVATMRSRGRLTRGLIPILTWSGLRGGISVAMVLSLPPFPARAVLLCCTYAVVVFSILVQGLTMRRVLIFYGAGNGRR
jgi:CPA1 family monovalent cation:H+ antiporter